MCNILCIMHIHVHLSSVNNASFQNWSLNVILFNVYTYHKFINTAATIITMNNTFSMKLLTRTVMSFASTRTFLLNCHFVYWTESDYHCITCTCNTCILNNACMCEKKGLILMDAISVGPMHSCRKYQLPQLI